jgi:drug/metabolite transporter (DMT)-like permease
MRSGGSRRPPRFPPTLRGRNESGPSATAGLPAPPRVPVSRRQGIVFLVTVVLAWGFTWPLNKLILASLPPIWAVAARSAIASVTLFAFAAATGRLSRPPRADLPVLLGITLLHMVGFSVLSMIGLAIVPAGRSVVLAYTTPLWVTPGAWLFLREPYSTRRALGVVVGLLGLAALFNPLAFDWSDRNAVLGNLAILGAAFLWAGSILQIRAHRWHSTPFALLPWELAIASFLLVPSAWLVAGVPAVDWSWRLVLLLLYAGLPGTALAYWAVAMAGRALPAVTTSLGLLATPVVGVMASAAWLGESVTASLVLAIALVLGGVALGVTSDR